MANLLSKSLRSGLAYALVKIGRVRLEEESLSPKSFSSPTIFYANHTSHLDFLLIWTLLPLRGQLHPVAAKDYWQVFPRSAPARFFHAYLVDRGGRGRRNQVKGMSQVLAAGDSILIFPEGTRGDGRTLGRFHRGLYFLAKQHPDVPVVPIRLRNLARILPKGQHVPSLHRATVAFLPPLVLRSTDSPASFLLRARSLLTN